MPENQTHENLADPEQDPGANTQMFRAFVSEGQAEPTEASKVSGRTLALVGGVVLLIVVIAAVFTL